MDAPALISLLATVVLLGIICYILWWAVEKIGLPEPFNKVAQAIIVLIVVIYLLALLTGNAPVFKWR